MKKVQTGPHSYKWEEEPSDVHRRQITDLGERLFGYIPFIGCVIIIGFVGLAILKTLELWGYIQ